MILGVIVALLFSTTRAVERVPGVPGLRVYAGDRRLASGAVLDMPKSLLNRRGNPVESMGFRLFNADGEYLARVLSSSSASSSASSGASNGASSSASGSSTIFQVQVGESLRVPSHK